MNSEKSISASGCAISYLLFTWGMSKVCRGKEILWALQDSGKREGRFQLYWLPLLMGVWNFYLYNCTHVDKQVLFPELEEMVAFLSLRRIKEFSSFEVQFNSKTNDSYNKLLALFRKLLKDQIPKKVFPNGEKPAHFFPIEYCVVLQSTLF